MSGKLPPNSVNGYEYTYPFPSSCLAYTVRPKLAFLISGINIPIGRSSTVPSKAHRYIPGEIACSFESSIQQIFRLGRL